MKLFETGCTLAPEYKDIVKNIQYISELELIPLFIHMESGDYDHYPENPNAYGVYIRYNEEGINKANLNPSEWLADFSSEQAAKAFKQLIEYCIL